MDYDPKCDIFQFDDFYYMDSVVEFVLASTCEPPTTSHDLNHIPNFLIKYLVTDLIDPFLFSLMLT